MYCKYQFIISGCNMVIGSRVKELFAMKYVLLTCSTATKQLLSFYKNNANLVYWEYYESNYVISLCMYSTTHNVCCYFSIFQTS